MLTRIASRLRPAVLVAAAIALVGSLAGTGAAAVTVAAISTDPYTNTSSYHRTQVEPDTFAFGPTIVAAFQSGRFTDGGASNIGWATSTNGGSTWTYGFLPHTTVYTTGGTFDRATDPSVAYDSTDGEWIIAWLALDAGVGGTAVMVSRSTNGTTWDNPITVAAATGSEDFDKTWIVCDNVSGGTYRGNCYAQWDDYGHNNQLRMSRSTDGGLTWTEASVPSAIVIGGQPVVQPNGNVVVPIDDGYESSVESFVSTNGGASYTGPYLISPIQARGEAGNLRSGPLPSAEIDAAGKIYVVWNDCRFRRGCKANDIVMSTSTNGTSWTAPVRIPIDGVNSGVDHFLPGLGVDPTTSGSTARLGLLYYFYASSGQGGATAATPPPGHGGGGGGNNSGTQLYAGFISSTTGGSSWGIAAQLAGPISLSWLPLTSGGYMVGDYFSTSFTSDHVAHPVFAVANTGPCQLGSITSCDEFTVSTSGLAATEGGVTHQTGAGKTVTTSNVGRAGHGRAWIR